MGLNIFRRGSLILNDELRNIWNENVVAGLWPSFIISLKTQMK
jgi:hypothetical protein